MSLGRHTSNHTKKHVAGHFEPRGTRRDRLGLKDQIAAQVGLIYESARKMRLCSADAALPDSGIAYKPITDRTSTRQAAPIHP